MSEYTKQHKTVNEMMALNKVHKNVLDHYCGAQTKNRVLWVSKFSGLTVAKAWPFTCV